MIDRREIRETLRQMVAVLQAERQALAELDIDAVMGTASEKSAICDQLSQTGEAELDEECRSLIEAARHLNEVNRQIRNLVAANVSARLNALTGSTALYNAKPAYSYASALG